MRPRDIRILAAFSLAVPLPAIPVLAEVAIRPGGSGQQGTWSSDGNFTLDGHCFGNVSSLPSDGVLSVFNNNAAFRSGNFFSLGSLNQSSTSFPDGFMVNVGSTQLASITPSGAFYLRGRCLNSSGCSNTIWEPTKWTSTTFIRRCNNCYNYGNDTRTDNFAQPGYASGHLYTGYNAAAVKAAALSDGLTWVGDAFPGNTFSCGNGHLIFMAVKPGTDYHWWRLDQTNSLWTHKRGETAPQTTDEQGHVITNPLTSERFGYTEPGGFFCNCGTKANIKGWKTPSQCGGTTATAAASPTTDSEAVFSVELDAFSGRSNPVFDLTTIEAHEFLLRIGSTCGAAASSRGFTSMRYPTDFLGYSGLTVFRSASKSQGNPTAQFSRGATRVFGQNPPDACRSMVKVNEHQDLPDAGQTTERYLIDLAHTKGVINDLEYGAILKEMHGKW